MIDFIRKHRVLTALLSVTLVVVVIMFFAGHAIGNAAIEQLSQYRTRNKMVCTINPKNATQIVYEGRTYQILNKTVPNSKIGGWNGVFRKVDVLDGHLCVITEAKSNIDSASQVAELKKHLPRGAKYIVTYFNMFAVKGIDEHTEIAVSLDKGTYRAIPVSKVTASETAIRFDPVG
ncbi:MAG TPA: NisI/SpaI family lantibiotic immunity lipoprotein [Oscillospiraceae bacterium]|nr:NisI/SpaI family lantibiotic immunity lipoprotein [Oscillospiraceae bacterium]